MSNRRPDMVNEWARNDLPHLSAVRDEVEMHGNGRLARLVDIALDTVVEHLNAEFPKSRNWRRAHEIVEGERDQARDQWKKWEHKAGQLDELVIVTERDRDLWHSKWIELVDELRAACRERDEWKDRAERADRELTDPYTQANQDSMAWNRVAAHPALRMDLLPDADHTYAGRVFERITQLAETAEAVTEMQPAPAVSREDVRGVIDRWIEHGGNHEALLDDLWSWVSGTDPAVYVVRKSQVDMVQVVKEESRWRTRRAGVTTWITNPDWAATDARINLIHALAAQRATEAKPAVDPVEERALELWHAAHPGTAPIAATMDTLRALARHQLGQEADR